jgi:biopolymer transport protein ExbB
MLDWIMLPTQPLIDFLDLGGWVVKWIALCAFVLWVLILERSWFFWRVLPRLRHGSIAQWQAREDHESWGAQRIRTAMLSELKQAMESGLPLIRVMVPMSPLLGLLGTVVGMLQVFDAMTVSRTADTRAMADGISHAMIATMAGLVVSLIGLFASYLLGSRVRQETRRLGALLS